MNKHVAQVMKHRAKLKRVEVLFRPEDYEAVREAASAAQMKIAAYIKSILKLGGKQ